MDDRIESVEVEFHATPEERGTEPSMEILRHIDRYDPPEEYPNRVSNLADLDVENLDRANYAVADHVPEELDALSDEPNVLTAGYVELHEVVDLQFLADYDRREDFYDAVDHVLEATSPLAIERLGVAYDLRADISAGREVGEIPTPETFLTEYRVSPEENRSEVSMSVSNKVDQMFEEVDVLEDLVQESLAFTTDRLLPER